MKGGATFALLSILCRLVLSALATDQVHLDLIAPPAGNCTDKDQEECISTVGDFSAGIRAAVTLAERHINQNGSYLHDRKLKLDFIEPESCERKPVLDHLFYDLFNTSLPPKLAVLGAGCTIGTEVVAEVSQYYAWSQMSFSTSSLSLSDRESFPFFFRTIPSDQYLLSAMLCVISAFSWTRATIITQDYPRFREFQRELTAKLSENVTIIRNQLVPKDLSQASTEELFPPDVRIIILNMDPRIGREMLCQAYQRLDWQHKRYAWLTPGWFQDSWWRTGKIVGGASTGKEKRVTNCTDLDILNFLWTQRVIGISPSLDEVANTTYEISSAEFTKEYQRELDNNDDFTRLAYFAYDAVWAVILALSNSNSTSIYQFDPFIISEENRRLGEMIQDSLENLQFTGVSGDVKFEEGSRIANKVDLLQYQPGSTTPRSLAWVSFSSGDPNKAYLRNGSSLWQANMGPPPDGTPYVVEQYPFLVLVIITNILACVTIILAVVCFIFTFIFRNRKLIRLSSPNLNFIIAGGSIVFVSSIFFFSYPPLSHEVLNVYCGIRSWLAAIGYSLCFGTINTKMWRVYYIFKNPKPSSKKKPLKDIHLVLCVVVFLVVDITILTISTGLNATRLEALVFPNKEGLQGVDDEGVTVNYVVVLCEATYKSLWLGILFGYKFIMQGVGVFLAFKIRKVKVKVLNDSKEVVATLYLTSIILVIVLVITIFFDEYIDVYAAGYSFGIILSTLCMLGVVFLSKMIRLYKDPKGETLFTHVTKDAGCTGASAIAMTVDDQKIMTLQRRINDLEGQVMTLQKTTEKEKNGTVPNGKHVKIVLNTSPNNSSHQD